MAFHLHYVCVTVSVCVCETRERERGGERVREGKSCQHLLVRQPPFTPHQSVRIFSWKFNNNTHKIRRGGGGGGGG